MNEETKQPEHVYVFISQSCNYCMELIQEIRKNEKIARVTEVVAVENTPRLPPGLTKVPAVLSGGKLKMGTEAFDFVVNYGEIGTSPVFTGNGFESDSYSSLDGGDSGGSDSFSFLGAENGMSGVDQSGIDKQNKMEQVQKGNNSVSMDNLTQQRNRDVQGFGGGGPGAGGRRSF